MKTYVALHYIPLGGRLITPGEIIDEPMTKAQREQFLSKKAIRAMADTDHSPNPLLDEDEDDDLDQGGTETNPNNDPDEQPPTTPQDDANASPGDDESDDDEEEADEEPPEIDVMAGVVAPADDPSDAAPATDKTAAQKRRKNP